MCAGRGKLSLFFNMFASIVGRVFLFREQLHKDPYSVPAEYIRARISPWLTASATFCVSRKRVLASFFCIYKSDNDSPCEARWNERGKEEE
jgi:hypothetical protein